MGNRQQSRFLALVNNYERLAELTEEAANSQDAGTLQYLKTLDSIESKINQLKVAFQEFYTSMGLENLFKGALAGLTIFINKLNSLPKMFDTIPIAALGMGINLISVIKNMASLLAAPLYKEFAQIKTKITDITGVKHELKFWINVKQVEKDAEDAGRRAAQAANRGASQQATSGQTGVFDYDQLLEGSDLPSRRSQNTLFKRLQKFYKKSRENGSAQLAGNALKLIGQTASTYFLTQTDSLDSLLTTGHENSKLISGLTGTAGNILGGAIAGGIPGLVIGLIQSIPNLITAFDGLHTSVNEVISAYDKEIESSKNIAIQSKATAKEALAEAQKLETLEEARYSSNDAMQKYLDYCNQLADLHPELISGYDGEHNAIIEIGDAYAYAADKAKLAAQADKDYKEKTQQRNEYVAAQAQILSKENQSVSTRLTGSFTHAFGDKLGWWRADDAAKNFNSVQWTGDANRRIEITNVRELLNDQSYKTNNNLAGSYAALIESFITPKKLTKEFWAGTNLEDKIPGLYQQAQTAHKNKNYQQAAERMHEILELILDEGIETLNEVADFAEKETQKSYAAIGVADFIAADKNYTNKQKTLFQSNKTLQGLYETALDNYLDTTDQFESMFNEEGQLLPEFSEKYKQILAAQGEYIANLILEQTFGWTEEKVNNLSDVLKNINKYSSTDEYKIALQKIGLNNEELLNAQLNLYEKNNEQIEEEVWAILKQGYDKELSFDLLGSYGNLTLLSNIGSFYKEAIIQDLVHSIQTGTSRSYRQTGLSFDIWSLIFNSGLEETLKQSLADSFAGVDRYDRGSLDTYIKELQNNELYQDFLTTDKGQELIEQLTELGKAASTNYNTIVSEYIEKAKTTIAKLDTVLKSSLSGMGYDDMLELVATLTAGTNLQDHQMVEWNKELQGFVLSVGGIRQARQKFLEEMEQSITVPLEELEKKLELLTGEDVWGPTQLEEFAQKDNIYQQLYDDWLEAEEQGVNYGDWAHDLAEQYQEAFDNFKASSEWIETYVNSVFGQLAWKQIDWNGIAQGTNLQGLKQIIDFLTAIGREDLIPKIEEMDLTTNLSEIYEMLREAGNFAFDYDEMASISQKQFAKAAEGIHELFNTQIGNILSKDVNALLANANVEGFNVNSLGVIESFDQMVEAAMAVYAAMTDKNSTLAQRNYAWASILEGNRLHQTEGKEILEKGAELSYDNLADFAILIGQELPNILAEQIYIIQDKFGNYQLTDAGWDTLAKAVGLSGYELVEAQKSYHESIIKSNKKIADNINEEIDALTKAKIGDKIDLSYVAKVFGNFGGAIVDGLLTITEDTNILGLAQQIRNQIETSGNELGLDIAALGDAIDELLKSYISLISSGIKGSLNQTGAATLKSFASGLGVNLDFTRTKDGLKLSVDHAGQLYSKLKQVDSISAKLVLDDLVESLEKAGSGFENISSTLARITELEKQMMTASKDELPALREKLDLYRDISVQQSQNPDSFSFMENKLPSGMQGAANYWDSVGEAYKVMNNAGKTGYMEIADFYNIVQQMKNLAIMGGNDLTFMGQTIYADGTGAAELITKGMSALSNIDGEGVKISMKKMGANVAGGAEAMAGGFDDAIKEVAKSQIAMLDAEIALLEAIVAMDELGSVDVNHDNELGEFEIFTDDNFDTFTTEFETARRAIEEQITNSEELSHLLDDLIINGQSLRTLLTIGAEEMSTEEAQKFVQSWNGLYKALASNDYDIEQAFSSVKDVLTGTGNKYLLHSKDHKKTLVIGQNESYEVEWDSKKTQEDIAEAFGTTSEKITDEMVGEVQNLLDKWSSGTTLTPQEELKLKVSLGKINITKDKEGNESYVVDGQTFSTSDQALKYLALRESGMSSEGAVQLTTTTENVEITEQCGKITATVKIGNNGEPEWTATVNNITCTGATREELLHNLWEQCYKESGVTEEEFRIAYHLNSSGPSFKVNGNIFSKQKKELKGELAQALSDGNYSQAEKVAFDMGVSVKLMDPETGDLNLENLEKLQDLVGIEDKTIVVTVQKGADTDATMEELLQANENTPLKRQMSVDVEASGEFTTAFVDSLNNLNTENLATVVLKLGALSNSLKKVQDADFSNVDTLATQWQAILEIVQEVQEVIDSLTNKTFTVNVNYSNNPQTQTGTTYTPNSTGSDGSGKHASKLNSSSSVGSGANTQIQLPQIPENYFEGILDSFEAAAKKVGLLAIEAGKGLNTLGENINKIPTNKHLAVNYLSTAMRNIPADRAQFVSNLAASMNQIKPVLIKISYTITGNGPRSDISVTGGGNETPPPSPSATGNVALAAGRRTLMGELGPELVVSHGHYYIVGQNGAEFVNLADDAIVFNHLQTRRLLANGYGGRGRAVTNERNATSLAAGTGPAMSSASDLLAFLKQLRAMWQALLNASPKELGSKAGSGGGGGGGGGDSKLQPQIGDFERWYNLLRQIEKWEQKINLAEAERKNMRSGYDISRSYQEELNYLQRQASATKELAAIQKDYYDKRRADLQKSAFSKIFTYDEDGLMQYLDGPGNGLDILAKISSTDENGRLIRNLSDTAVNQLKYLKSVGFDYSKLAYDEEKADHTLNDTNEDDAAKILEHFWDQLEGWQDELDGLYDSYHEQLVNYEEILEKQQEILQKYIDNQLEVEDKLKQAIEDREQAIIDALKEEKDAMQKAAKEYLDGLNKALKKEKDLYTQNETANETAKLQRQLAILQRSGASASEISSLQKQISSRLRDSYFDEQQKQIDAIQEASDAEIERLDRQIEILTDSLEYQKENGLLWAEVSEKMENWSPEAQLEFIERFTKSWKELSALGREEESRETQQQLEIQAHKQQSDAAWKSYEAELAKKGITAENGYNMEQIASAYKSNYSKENPAAAEEAAINDANFQKIEIERRRRMEENKRNGAYALPAGTGGAGGSGSAEGRIPFGSGKTFPISSSSSTSPLIITRNPGDSIKDKENILAELQQAQATAYLDAEKVKWFEVKFKDKNNNDVRGWINADALSSRLSSASLQALRDRLKELQKTPGFASGGMSYFTGPAILHGTKTKPEAVLNAEQTKFLREELMGDSEDSLINTVRELRSLRETWQKETADRDTLQQFRDAQTAWQTAHMNRLITELEELYDQNKIYALQQEIDQMHTDYMEQQQAMMNIENIDINIESGVISSDYDAHRAAAQVMDELYAIARKNSITLSRR